MCVGKRGARGANSGPLGHLGPRRPRDRRVRRRGRRRVLLGPPCLGKAVNKQIGAKIALIPRVVRPATHRLVRLGVPIRMHRPFESDENVRLERAARLRTILRRRVLRSRNRFDRCTQTTGKVDGGTIGMPNETIDRRFSSHRLNDVVEEPAVRLVRRVRRVVVPAVLWLTRVLILESRLVLRVDRQPRRRSVPLSDRLDRGRELRQGHLDPQELRVRQEPRELRARRKHHVHRLLVRPQQRQQRQHRHRYRLQPLQRMGQHAPVVVSVISRGRRKNLQHARVQKLVFRGLAVQLVQLVQLVRRRRHQLHLLRARRPHLRRRPSQSALHRQHQKHHQHHQRNVGIVKRVKTRNARRERLRPLGCWLRPRPRPPRLVDEGRR